MGGPNTRNSHNLTTIVRLKTSKLLPSSNEHKKIKQSRYHSFKKSCLPCCFKETMEEEVSFSVNARHEKLVRNVFDWSRIGTHLEVVEII